MKVVRKKISLDNLKIHHFPRILAGVLLIVVTLNIILFWLKIISFWSLVVAILGLVAIELLFILGIRIVQRDAFLDGFRNGSDSTKKLRKKS